MSASTEIVHLEPPDYLYGTEPLRLRVTDIGATLNRFPTLEWIRLIGTEIHSDGQDGRQLSVLVHVATLHAQQCNDAATT